MDEDRESIDEVGAHTISNDHNALMDEDDATTALESAAMDGYERSADGAIKTRIVRLPTEVHERIIGFLDSPDENATVAACALVCRAWLPFSRFKLYYIIYLQYPWRWFSFRKFTLHSKSAAIQGYLSQVRELEILVHERPSDY